MKKFRNRFENVIVQRLSFAKALGCICCLFLLVLKSGAQASRPDTTLTVHLNMPRFLYEGDRLEVIATIANHSTTERTSQLQLQLLDTEANTPVDGWFQNIFPVQYFTAEVGKTERLRFPLEVPFLFRKAVRWRVLEQDTLLQEGLVSVLAAADSLNATKATTFPVQIRKQVFLKRAGRLLRTLAGDTTTIHVGDSLNIQLSITAARDMAQVQLTDALAAAFAPAIIKINKAAQYIFSQTGDSASIKLFMPLLHKGRTVVDYTVAVTHAGVFYIGPATIQSAKLPEQKMHSKASQIRIEE